MQNGQPLEKINILGALIDNVTMDEAIKKVNGFLSEDRVHSIFTPNAEIIMEAYRDPDFRHILNQADLVVPDGAGVILASRLLDRPLKEKVSGLDLTKNILEKLGPSGLKVFLFGAKPGVAEMAAAKIKNLYPKVEIVGTQDGYSYQNEDLIARINDSGAELLLVGLGAPKQEKWIYSHKDKLKVKVCMGIGGTIDVYAGTVKKAPEFIRRAGFEWLYRLIRQPSRFKRQMDLPRFVIQTLKCRREERKRAHTGQ